ncbi:MAG: amidase [Deltaproteobacteria bacterium]|nr:amidase [Deltaproteobacteria bacterium]
MSALGVSALSAAFKAGADDPVQALARARESARRGKDDKAILWNIDGAETEAEASRARWKSGAPLSPIDGVPLVVKDCIDVAGYPTTNGTKFLMDKVPKDAALVARLRAAGAVIFAKTNMHEFGIQPTGVNPHHGTARNPWDGERIPGGSSSGSAVAVASGIAPAAIGTDAGGSVRIPAALNGLVGLKPTFGAVPTEGVAALTRDLDHAGPIAWTVEDATLLFEALAQVKIDRALAPGKLALLTDFFEGAEPFVIDTVRNAASDAFGGLPEVRTPLCAWATAVEFVIVGTDASALMAGLLKQHAKDLGWDARTILQLGGGLGQRDRDKADRLRAGMRRELDSLLETHDLLIGPATGKVAPKLHPTSRRSGELDTTELSRLAAVTFPANLTGHPSITVPCVPKDSSALPVGLQLIGRHGDEARVLAAARAIEAKRGLRHPPRWWGL